MQLRCPQCGAENRDDSLDFPLCHQCHEQLVACRQCRHFGQRAAGAPGCLHPTLGRQFRVTPYTAPPCGHFSPRPRSLAISTPLSQMHRAIWALAALLLLGSMLFAASALVSRVQPTDEVYLDLMAETPGPLAVGDRFCVNLLIHNQSDRASTPLTVVLPYELVQGFQITAISPTPTGEQDREQGHCLTFPSVRGHGWLDVRLDLQSIRTGTYDLRALLLDDQGAVKSPARFQLVVN